MDTSPELLLRILGRLHPILVHFPVALLVLAGLLEVFRRRDKPSNTTLVCLVFGSLGAAAAAWSGWEFFEHDGPGESRTMWLHRWGGVSVASLSLICVLLGLVVRNGTRPRVMPFFRSGVVLCMVLVGFVAHQGGKSVWGDGFLLELLDQEAGADAGTTVEEPDEPREAPPTPAATAKKVEPSGSGTPAGSVPLVPLQRATTKEPATSATPSPALLPASTGVDFATQIQPIFEASCYRCHGPKKRPKGGLRLSDMPDVFAGAQEDWVIQPGDAVGSLLHERITLPTDHEDFMPLEGDPLTDEQVRLIRAWIDEGAKWPATPEDQDPGEAGGESETADLGAQDELLTVVFPELLELDGPQRAARDAAVRLLLDRGAYAGQIALNTDEVDVNLGLLAERADDDSLALLEGLEPCLVSLDLSRSAVTSAGLARLRDFPRLQRLRLDHTAVDDAGMQALAALPGLEYLNLVGTSVGDDGLVRLEGLRGLRKLFLWQTPVTDAGAERLARALPQLSIVRDTLTPVVVEADPAPARSAGCCDAARAAGKDCDHPCCVEAAAKGEVCPTCSA